MDEYLGHNHIKKYFDEAIDHKSLAHCHCFCGPKDVGKRHMALSVASKLLGIQIEKLSMHPDFYEVDIEIDLKSKKKKKNISISQARELKRSLSSKPWLAEYQVVIINSAHLLSQGAGSALLKLLEESTTNIVFFLITENEEMLLSTIKSRSQLLFFQTFSDRYIQNLLIKKGNASEAAELITGFSCGRPARALKLTENDDLLNQQIILKKEVEEVLNAPLSKALALINKKAKDLVKKEKEETINFLELMQMICRKKMLNAANGDNDRLNRLKAMSVIDHIETAKKKLHSNANTPLVFDEIILTAI
ncbi:MAG: hypothetical protein ABH832_00185 [bacterium]